MDPERPIRVMLVDDHPIVLDGLRAVLEVAGIEVSATAGTVAETLSGLRAGRADVVVMDVHLPDGSGIIAVAKIRRAHPEVRLVMLTMAGDEATLSAALAAGAHGYVVKGAPGTEIVRAVQAVAAGQVIFGAAVADAALKAATARPSSTAPFRQLTDREHAVLELIADGMANPAIARTLGISAKTAANHVSAILTKLGVTDRTQAALLARDNGLGRRPAF